MDAFKQLDAFSKTVEDARLRTASGGVVSAFALSVMFVLTISEFAAFLTVDREYTLSVDSTRDETLQIFLDVDLPKVQCHSLGVNAEDTTGSRQLDISHDLSKTAILPSGQRKALEQKVPQKLPSDYCGSCYGAKPQAECCNTCDAVQRAYSVKGWVISGDNNVEQCVREGRYAGHEYHENEGCNIKGHVSVGRVKGRLQILIGHSIDFGGMTLHDISDFTSGHKIDLSHKIISLSFGKQYPGMINPMDGTTKQSSQKLGVYEYFMKVVPTTYRPRWGSTIISNQYSVTEYFRASDPTMAGTKVPGIDFEYDFSPIRVDYIETRGSFFHFVTQLCAIVGGVYTVSSLVDSGFYSALMKWRKGRSSKLL